MSKIVRDLTNKNKPPGSVSPSVHKERNNATKKGLPNKASKRSEDLSLHTEKDVMIKALKEQLDSANKQIEKMTSTAKDVLRRKEETEQQLKQAESTNNDQKITIKQQEMKITEYQQTIEQLKLFNSDLKCLTTHSEKRLEKRLDIIAKEHKESLRLQAQTAEEEKQKSIKEIVLEAEQKQLELEKKIQQIERLFCNERKARLKAEEDLEDYTKKMKEWALFRRAACAESRNNELLKETQEQKDDITARKKQIKDLTKTNNQLKCDYDAVCVRLDSTLVEYNKLQSKLKKGEKVYEEKLERATHTYKQLLQHKEDMIEKKDKAFRNMMDTNLKLEKKMQRPISNDPIERKAT